MAQPCARKEEEITQADIAISSTGLFLQYLTYSFHNYFIISILPIRKSSHREK